MKLELKHIAPYLPYGLKGIAISENEGIETVLGVKVANTLGFDFITDIDDIFYNDFKPLLRPLSDLTKEIEHNGEKFVPIERIKESQRHLFFRNDIDAPLDGLQFSEIQKLFSWHFDVFGLIEQGLAIDLNTVKN